MSFGHAGEKSFFNLHKHVTNGKVEKGISELVMYLCQNEVGWNQWPMPKVTEVFKDNSGYVQSVKLKVGKTNMSDQSNTALERPVAK